MARENEFGNIDLRVMEGIQLFDQRAEKWRKKIDIKKLDTSSPTNHPLAQVFGSYEAGCAELRLNNQAAILFGFQAQTKDPAEHVALTKKWQELVPAT